MNQKAIEKTELNKILSLVSDYAVLLHFKYNGQTVNKRIL